MCTETSKESFCCGDDDQMIIFYNSIVVCTYFTSKSRKINLQNELYAEF